MLVFDRENWPRHRGWCWAVVIVSLAAIAWYAVSAFAAGFLPGGSSAPGFTFGVVGGLIIVFECLLWARKKVRAWRLGRAQDWLRAHIWLGLLCLPLLILHGGLRWGGTLSTTLLALLIIVVVSGVLGLVLQNVLPRRMMREAPAETIYSQIDYVAEQLANEAERLVDAVCGAEEGSGRGRQAKELEAGDFLVVGAVRAVGQVQGKVLETRVLAAPVADAEPLRDFYRHQAAPFLRRGSAGGGSLGHVNQAKALFRDLRTRLNPDAHPVVDDLESLCEQRRQLDVQARLQFWLHSWLWVHLPLSASLLVFMLLHVFVALKYW